jgi:hypothetical protein
MNDEGPALSSAFSVLSARADRWKAAAKRERASADLQSALVRQATNRAGAARAEGEAAGRAAEREACAKVADLHADGAHPDDCIGCRTARGIAAAIRARGEADQ